MSLQISNSERNWSASILSWHYDIVALSGLSVECSVGDLLINWHAEIVGWLFTVVGW
jgi:hypothetical protein